MILVVPFILGTLVLGYIDWEDRVYYWTISAVLATAALVGAFG